MRLLKILVIVCAALSIVLNAFLIWYLFSSPGQSVPVVTNVGEPIVIHTKGGLLEVSKVTNTEQFQTSKDHTIFGISIGNTVSCAYSGEHDRSFRLNVTDAQRVVLRG